MFSYRNALLTGAFALAASSCSPLEFIFKEIRELGFIEYQAPIAYAGTGTLVGGKQAEDLFLVTDPTTCFPEDSGLRRRKDVDLPSRQHQVSFKGSARADVFKFLGSGNNFVKAGVEFDHVKSVTVDMKDVQVEFLDSVALTRYYRDHMDETCVEWLNRAAFVIEALYVGEMTFEMTSEDGGKIELDADIASKYIEVEADLEWEIKDGAQLVVKSPKYVGYKLGRLTASDDGMSVFRANSLKMGEYDWQEISQFDEDLWEPPANDERVPVASSVPRDDDRLEIRSVPLRAPSFSSSGFSTPKPFPQPVLSREEMIELDLLPRGYQAPW